MIALRLAAPKNRGTTSLIIFVMITQVLWVSSNQVMVKRKRDEGRNYEVYRSTDKRSGYFSSKNYPQPYPKDKEYEYFFQGKGRERVQINFLDFNLYYPGDPQKNDRYICDQVDTVVVTIDLPRGESEEIYSSCGNHHPPLLMSRDQNMGVVFRSRENRVYRNFRGFNATYKFVTDFGISQTGGVQMNHTECGFLFTSSPTNKNGTFTSPNYPGLYPKNIECHYIFQGNTNEKVKISFEDFHVEGVGPFCKDDTLKSDYVEFSNFELGVRDKGMDRYCGQKEEILPPPVTSDLSYLRMAFKSNDKYELRGFKARYQFLSKNGNPSYTVSGANTRTTNTWKNSLMILSLACVCFYS